MFSGLVETKAKILAVSPEMGGIRLSIARPAAFSDVAIGDSIAVSGCCLTVVELDAERLDFQAGEETLRKTNLGSRIPPEFVNCERSLRLADRVGGHLVTGHVDGQGKVQDRSDNADWSDLVFQAPPDLMRQMASKGSITVDGVSLTLVDVTDETFSVALIPHTLAHTTLGELRIGDTVNLETDLLAKYVQRQLNFGSQNPAS